MNNLKIIFLGIIMTIVYHSCITHLFINNYERINYADTLAPLTESSLSKKIRMDGIYVFKNKTSDSFENLFGLYSQNDYMSNNIGYDAVLLMQFDTFQNLSFSCSLLPNFNDIKYQLKAEDSFKWFVPYYSGMFAMIFIQTKGKSLESKLRALNQLITPASRRFWYIVKNLDDTISIQSYIFKEPMMVYTKNSLSTYKFKIMNDTLLKYIEYIGASDKVSFSDSNYYFKFYKTDVRIDFSKSFFNTNKSYLRYSKRMRKKEEKLKAKQRYKEVK